MYENTYQEPKMFGYKIKPFFEGTKTCLRFEQKFQKLCDSVEFMQSNQTKYGKLQQ